MDKNPYLSEFNVEANPEAARIISEQVPDSILSEPFFAPLVSVVSLKEVPTHDHSDLAVPVGSLGEILSVSTDDNGEVYYVVAFLDDSNPLSILKSVLGFVDLLFGHYDPSLGVRLAVCKQDEIVPVNPGPYYDFSVFRAFRHLVSGDGFYYEELVN